jgi:hypothetical protein
MNSIVRLILLYYGIERYQTITTCKELLSLLFIVGKKVVF